MADTQRTRAALQALFADNVVGAISPQDLRDFLVTAMQPEFVNANDFWCGPDGAQLTTDKTTRGWHLYSQIVSSTITNGLSAMKIYAKTASNVWSTADPSQIYGNAFIGVANDSYAQNVSTAVLLVWGVVYDSAMSAYTASAVGLPLYLCSVDSHGQVSVTAADASRMLGWVLNSGVGQSTAVGTGKWFFDPHWGVASA